MEESGDQYAKVRVVRCPKCDKLLPELPNFTVYRCGGCNATLQAKGQIPGSEASSERSDGGRGENIGFLDNPRSPLENKEGVLDGSSESDEDNHEIKLRRELLLANPDRNSVSTTEVKGGIPNELSVMEGRESRYRLSSKAPIGEPNTNGDELLRRNLDHESKVDYANGYHEARQRQAWRKDVERDRSLEFRRASKTPIDPIQPSLYPDEGPSNYHLNHSYKYDGGNPTNKLNPDGPTRVEHLEQDRAELLRKLDELRDQLKRSCEITDKPKERAPANKAPLSSSSYNDRGRRTWLPEGSASMNPASGHHSRYSDVHNMDRTNYYPSIHAQNEAPRYREALGMAGRTTFHPHSQYPQRPMNNYMYGQFDPDPVISYHHDGFYHHDSFYHQPACSCLHCHNTHWLPPAHAPPAVFNNQRVPYLVNNNGSYPGDSPSMLGPQSFNQRFGNAPLHPHDPRIQHRSAFVKKDGRSFRPIAGATPFIVCHNCFKLLQIPEDIYLTGKSQRKLRCGSCSEVISLKVDGRRLTTSVPVPNSQVPSDPNHGMKGDHHVNRHIPYSGDYDSASFDVHSTEEKVVLPSTFPTSSQELIERDYGLHPSGSEKMQGLSFSSSASENVESPDSIVCQRDVPSSAEFPLESEETSRVSSLPLREHFGYPLPDKVVGRSGKGSMSKRSEQEKTVSMDANFKQNSVKDVPVATEMDLSDEYPDPDFPQDSCPWEASRDEDEPRISKGGESFFVGFIKKSLKDFSRFNQSVENGRSKVSVNGHPLSDRIIKKAEKLAGPIHPGEYWYDYRAGFWGVMGHQCLGILPPFIEEFNYPIPKKCAGGNTGVLLNGRELHQNDLDLLVGRGLPATEDRSYIVEISGKVWDEASGEELDSLGKLAPTIEKVKHGFGMRVPRVVA